MAYWRTGTVDDQNGWLWSRVRRLSFRVPWLPRETVGPRCCRMSCLAAMVSASAGQRPCSPSNTCPRQWWGDYRIAFASLIFDRLTCAPQVSLLLEVSWCRTTDSCRRVVYFQTGCEEHILVTTIPAGSEPKSPRPQSYMRRQQHDSSKESQGFTPLFIFAHPHFKIVPCPPRICATRN